MAGKWKKSEGFYEMTDAELKGLIERFVKATAADLASFKAAIARLEENQRAEHAKMLEMATSINGHSKLFEQCGEAWTKNFAELGELVNKHSQMLEAIRSILNPPTVN